MTKYYLTNKAVDDLTEIWEYTFKQWSEEQADNYYKTLISNCEMIANNQKLGKPYSNVAFDLLGFKVNRHIIFYRTVKNTEVEITRILHGRMDLKTRILE